MTKGTQNLKPDIVLKNYWNDNHRFADLFNAVLFGGQGVIQPEELEDVDAEESSVLENRGYAESLQASRDNIKQRKNLAKHGVQLVLLGQEAQEHIHYAMPIRVMGYDYGTYKKQYDSNAGKYRSSKGLTPDEYLSRMREGDRFFPVVTLVVYYGEKPWNGARSLHDLLDVPPEMKKYVNDYKLLLVEARKNDLALHNADNVDLFCLIGILQDTGKTAHQARGELEDYIREHEVAPSVLMAVAGAARCRVDYNALSKKGDAGIMYRVFEELAEESRREGRKEGEVRGIIETGLAFGIAENDILGRLQEKLRISLQAAKEYWAAYAQDTKQ